MNKARSVVETLWVVVVALCSTFFSKGFCRQLNPRAASPDTYDSLLCKLVDVLAFAMTLLLPLHLAEGGALSGILFILDIT